MHAIILGFDWRSEFFDGNGVAGQFWTHCADPKGVRHRESGGRCGKVSSPHASPLLMLPQVILVKLLL